jgi:hypothetical protein
MPTGKIKVDSKLKTCTASYKQNKIVTTLIHLGNNKRTLKSFEMMRSTEVTEKRR